MPDFAPGIPYSKDKAPLPDPKKPQDWDYVLHEHHAERAGKHFDLRLSDGQKAFSWAVPKGLPDPGEKRLAVRQPDHRPSYMPFEGEIAEGYGKGKVSVADSGPVRVLKAEDNKVQFVLLDKRDPDQFTMVRTQGDNWLLMNNTPLHGKYDLDVTRPKYKESPASEVATFFNPEYMFQPKVDGAHGVTEFKKGKVRVFSPRASKRSDRYLQYTHKIDGVDSLRVPDKLDNTVVRGEIFGELKDGTIIPAQRLAGILNSKPTNSRIIQAADGITLKQMLFDVEKYRGKDMRRMPYKERHKIVEEIVSNFPKFFTAPKTAKTITEKAKLVSDIKSGKTRETKEGVVAWNMDDPIARPVKIKFKPDSDVYVVNIFPGKEGSKYEGTHAGGFEYSHTPGGPVAGRVGTGFTDSDRKEMWANKKEYIGRAARVSATEQYTSGALRTPSFINWHMDK